ncbi:alpha-(1,3)-fucosyltransferase 10-like [Saccostrea cucullata]|uniref:alpha-(1,3)-fucosyltransferase 10-like n=1 Tax=Saccostrea cuccullata TaxID=36930 RepID=UPI002ED426A0
MRVKNAFKLFILCFVLIFFAIFIAMMLYGGENYDGDNHVFQPHYDDPEDLNPDEEKKKSEEKITEPIILWWTPFTGEPGRYKKCGNVKCYFTVNRHYRNNPQTKVFMFYGTDFKYFDLPLPRKPHHEWALLHEESPKNNFLFSFEEVMTLFNHTCTFRRESDYPITTQYIDSVAWLFSSMFLLSAKEKTEQSRALHLAPMIYAHSDCGTPSDRDGFVYKLMNHIKIDSYGSCLHNKKLPDHLRDPLKGMFHDDFYKLIAKYKFAAAMENGICNDYVTEKLWRPLFVGTIPIVIGSPRIKDLLPSNKSAIIVDDFDSIEDLAKYLKFLDENDEEYDKYMEWKKTGIKNQYLLKILKEREWAINDYTSNDAINFIDGFECFVCKRIHENIQREKKGKEKLKFQATVDHYGCPAPSKFDDNGKRTLKNDDWGYEYLNSKYYAKALRFHLDMNKTIDRSSIASTANRFRAAGDLR